MAAKELKVFGETVLMPVSNIVNDDGTEWTPPTVSTELVNLGTLSTSGTLTTDQVMQIGTTTVGVTARASVNSVTRFYERVNISGTTAMLISADDDALHVLTVNLSTRAYALSDISLGGDFNPSGSYPNLTAGTAASATKATQDGNGDVITSTYAKQSALLDLMFPVGSIYMNYENSSSPASTLGGSWTRIYNKFLIGAGSDYTIGTEGGEEFHQLTKAETPSHDHSTGVRMKWVDTPQSNALTHTWASSTGNLVILTNPQPYTSSVGGDTPHNNMPPYRAVWMWRRTA